MVTPARECVTILLGLVFELAEIAKSLLSNIQRVKYFGCQIICFIKSSADQETATSGRMERGEEGRSPDVMLGNYRYEAPELILLRFSRNSLDFSRRVKAFDVQKLIRECSKVSFARGLFRKRDAAGIAPAGSLKHILPPNE